MGFNKFEKLGIKHYFLFLPLKSPVICWIDFDLLFWHFQFNQFLSKCIRSLMFKSMSQIADLWERCRNLECWIWLLVLEARSTTTKLFQPSSCLFLSTYCSLLRHFFCNGNVYRSMHDGCIAPLDFLLFYECCLGHSFVVFVIDVLFS